MKQGRNLATGLLHVLPRARPAAGVLCAWVVALCGTARGQALSVAEFNAKVAQWRADNADPPPVGLRVEGRVVLFARDRLRLRNCPVPFVADGELPEIDRATRNVEVRGRAVRDAKSGEYQVQIQSLNPRQSDLEEFNERRRALRQASSEKWHQLGEWATNRGRFYNDQALIALGEEAHLKGIALDRDALASGAPEALFALAERARKFAVPTSAVQEVIHDGCLRLWEEVRGRTGGSDLAKVLEQIGQRLPGAKEPLPYQDAELSRQYFKHPRDTYRDANKEKRRALHRLLYLDVLMRTLAPAGEPKGSTLLETAALIDRLAPENHHLADQYREQALDLALELRTQDLERLTRAEVLKLAEEYRGRQRADTARQVVERWLTLRLRRLEPDDTEGLIELTAEYRALLQDHTLPDRLLIEAHARNPKAADIAKVLEDRGYHWHEGRWLTAEQYLERPESRFERAIRNGRVEIGMNQSQVRRALGEPQLIVRSITSGQLTEIWRYILADQSPLTLRLERKSRQAELLLVQ
jgi:hypothetical protein